MSSFQPASKTEIIQETGEAFHLLMLPVDILTRILKLLDEKTLALTSPRVCKRLYGFCGRYTGVLHPFPGYMGHIYKQLMSREEETFFSRRQRTIVYLYISDPT